MVPWILLDSAQASPGGEELRLLQRGAELSIRVGRRELMNSRASGSERELAELARAQIGGRASPHILIGGLGMGYTLAAALDGLAAGGRVIVAELVPEVVAWNRGPLADLAGRPLEDERVEVAVSDVADVIRAREKSFDAILLDVDNGPRALTAPSNAWLYEPGGLRAARAALRAGGVLAVWSAGADDAFARRLRSTGFEVSEHHVRARGKRGAHHTIWIARGA